MLDFYLRSRFSLIIDLGKTFFLTSKSLKEDEMHYKAKISLFRSLKSFYFHNNLTTIIVHNEITP